MSTQNCWSLMVLTTNEETLPRISWMPPDKPQTVFGFSVKYYNPCDPCSRPQTLPKKFLGFYGVEQPFPANPVCDLSRDSIALLALYSASPGQALMQYQALGLEKFIQAAQEVHYIAQVAAGAAA